VTLWVSLGRLAAGIPFVRLLGRFDTSGAQLAEDVLRRVEGKRPTILVLDLSEVEDLGMLGRAFVVSADARAAEGGRQLRVVFPTRPLPRTELEGLGLVSIDREGLLEET
jgi:anti-anti-sigma regulatory factor